MNTVTIDGTDYRLSMDCSLFAQTDSGQKIVPAADALKLLAKSKTKTANAMAALIRSNMPQGQGGIRERLRSRRNASWGSAG